MRGLRFTPRPKDPNPQAVPILFCSLELYLPYCHSLKEKRRIVRKTADRLRARFNFSISEIEHQDTWQRCRMAAVSVGPNRIALERLSEKFIRESERILGGDLVDYYIEFYEHD